MVTKRRSIADIRVGDFIYIANPICEIDEFIAKVIEVQKNNNVLWVEILKNYDSWKENWNLEHTKMGLKSRYYRIDTE